MIANYLDEVSADWESGAGWGERYMVKVFWLWGYKYFPLKFIARRKGFSYIGWPGVYWWRTRTSMPSVQVMIVSISMLFNINYVRQITKNPRKDICSSS